MADRFLCFTGLLLLVATSAATSAATLADECVFDYAPCQCAAGGAATSSYRVTCLDVGVDQVRAVFQRTPVAEHASVQLTARYNQLPANVLGDKRTQQLVVDCVDASQPLLAVDADWLAASRGVCADLRFVHCDLASLADWTFLADLDGLQRLRLASASLGAGWTTLPTLPALQNVVLSDVVGFNQWYAPERTPLLSSIELDYLAMTPSQLDQMLDTFLFYSTTLTKLQLWNVGLTRFPATIGRMTRLEIIYVKYDVLQRLDAGSVTVGPNLRSLLIESSAVGSIEAGALPSTGLESAYISLYNNKLRRLEQDAFLPLLLSMAANGTAGRRPAVSIQVNPFECGCDLAWLLRDRRHLLEHVWDGRCVDGTDFEDVDVGLFDACP